MLDLVKDLFKKGIPKYHIIIVLNIINIPIFFITDDIKVTISTLLFVNAFFCYIYFYYLRIRVNRNGLTLVIDIDITEDISVVERIAWDIKKILVSSKRVVIINTSWYNRVDDGKGGIEKLAKKSSRAIVIYGKTIGRDPSTGSREIELSFRVSDNLVSNESNYIFSSEILRLIKQSQFQSVFFEVDARGESTDWGRVKQTITKTVWYYSLLLGEKEIVKELYQSFVNHNYIEKKDRVYFHMFNSMISYSNWMGNRNDLSNLELSRSEYHNAVSHGMGAELSMIESISKVVFDNDIYGAINLLSTHADDDIFTVRNNIAFCTCIAGKYKKSILLYNSINYDLHSGYGKNEISGFAEWYLNRTSNYSTHLALAMIYYRAYGNREMALKHLLDFENHVKLKNDMIYQVKDLRKAINKLGFYRS